MGQFKSTIIFFACFSRRTTNHCSVLHRASSLKVILHASTTCCWNCGSDRDEMRDVFPPGGFQPNCPVVCYVCPCQTSACRVYVLLYMQHIHGARWSLWGIIWLHAAEGIFRERERESGGKMKARLMRWGVYFCYQGAVQWKTHIHQLWCTVVNRHEACAQLNTHKLSEYREVGNESEEWHVFCWHNMSFILILPEYA